MNKAFFKDILREIKVSLGRFLSILCIVAIGVAFFAGIKASAPDMKNSADTHFDTYNVQDIQIYSTLGITKDDIEEIKHTEGVQSVQGSFSMDTLSQLDSTQLVVKVISLPKKQNVNKIRLMEGRMPKKANECLIEAYTATNQLYGSYKVGDTIELESGDASNLKDSLKNTKFKIVGSCYNPNYLSYEKGSSNIGSGMVNTFIYVPEKNILADYYTEADVLVEGAKSLDTYSDEYFDLVKPVVKRLKNLGWNLIQDRIEDQSEALEKAKEDAQEELEKAQEQLDDAQAQIDQGQSTIQEKESTLSSAQSQLSSGWNEYYQNLALLDNLPLLNDAIAQIEQGEAKLPELQTNLIQVQSGLTQLITGKTQLQTALTILNKGIAPLESRKTILESYLADPNINDEQKVIYQAELDMITCSLNELYTQQTNLNNQITELDAKQKDLESALLQIQNGIAQINAGISQKATLISQRDQLLSAKGQLNNAYNTLKNSEAQLADGQNQLNAAKEKLQSSQDELNAAKSEFETRQRDAKDQFEQAQVTLDGIEGKWILLDRNSHYSYRDYGACADRMDGIAKVFPVFFFLVAALVCMTTMSRMVEEQRNEMGTLKALGYSKIQIASKFIVYALLASIIGSIVGCAIGMYLFPMVIFTAWNTLYNLEKIVFAFQPGLMFTASISVIGITLLATLYSIIHELMEVPSQLMRPKAAKAGKKILLEKIPFIWDHLSFLRKVTARNIFRYKKRFFMTVIGISGCSALVLAGFGINDSISDIVHQQYEVVYHYDASINTDNEDLAKELLKIKGIKDVYEEDNVSATTKIDDKDLSTIIHIIDDEENLDSFTSLFNKKETLTLSDDGICISQKMASKLNKNVGDTLTFKDSNGKKLNAKITGIFENYVGHHIYVTRDVFNTWKSKANQTKVYLIKTSKQTKKFERNLGNKIMNLDGVTSISFYSSLQKNFKDMIQSISYIVVVLVISAAALAFVVLYNLSNVNISERLREIATIKVLGFTDKEVNQYVNRETILLTMIGALTGLVIGIGLHHLIMNLAEMDDIMFGRTIKPISYVISFCITMIFSFIVNLFMHIRLKKIQMVESLKAVE